ncbi:MAG: MotA/TolQ/ExbB proton channel family protein [Verrucomicrobiota bacterium JB022]|nr:MotA/TolQ/ExbB proton channel family protein [Verrucomicrobiota bacterium JB022]
MFIIIGFVIVFISAMGGFILAGGNPAVLVHVSEFVVIGGISLGILIISTPINVLKHLMADLLGSFKGSPLTQAEVDDLFKMLYELFMLGRRNGLLALDEHMSDPASSSLFSKYPSFTKDHKRLEFLVNSLRPIIDGKIKPEQLTSIMEKEVEAMEEESHHVTGVLLLVGDSLPGVGIVAAVLGIINTMTAISEGPDAVGHKVAAALTGTFLGIFAAYGFVNPMAKNLEFRNTTRLSYFKAMMNAVIGFTRGLSPIMALEIARRGLPEELMIEAERLEEMMKDLG